MLIFLLLGIIVIIRGPAVWDRLLGLNIVSAKTLMIIILLAGLYGSSQLLEFAVVYALLGFIGTVFTAHFIMERKKSVQKLNLEKAEEDSDGNSR